MTIIIMGKKGTNLRKRSTAATTKQQDDDNKKKDVTTEDDDPQSKNKHADEKEDEENGRLMQFLIDFPLMSAAMTVGLLLGLYRLCIMVVLQYPHLLALRPAVLPHEERQLLIVSTQGSGSTQLAETLSSTLSIEMGHETSDATQHFVRDGTVSWFHGIRFLEGDAPLNVDMLCTSFKTHMGFHPSRYGFASKCNTNSVVTNFMHFMYDTRSDAELEALRQCKQDECKALLQKEKGCALRHDCPTPFRTTLHLARHPLRTIESLVVKFCHGTDLHNVTMAPEILYYMVAMFPHTQWLELSCVEAMAMYVTQYSEILVAARLQMGGRFRIEESTPCQVAEMAGFTSVNPVHAPNYAKVQTRCQDTTSKANEVFPKGKNQRNKDMVTLKWKDLRGGAYGSRRPEGDTEIEEQVKDLAHNLGYADTAMDEDNNEKEDQEFS